MILDLNNIWSNINHNCVFCDLISANKSICHDCFEDLPRPTNPCLCCAIDLPVTSKYQYCHQCVSNPPPFKRTYAAFNYQFPINLVIPKIKKERQRFHLTWLAAALAAQISNQPSSKHPQALIPVPISMLKKIYKGYNQTEQLAQYLGKLLKIPVDDSLVLKYRNTRPQAELNARERKQNLQQAFSVTDNIYQHVAIIDDVMTTGSTAIEIAKALRETGIEQVDLWILARTPL